MIYSLTLLNGHYIVEIEGNKLIVDTGNPYDYIIMFRRIPNLRINNQNVTINDDSSPQLKENTERLVGTRVDGILGYSILKKGFTLKNNSIEFGIPTELNGRRLQTNFMQTKRLFVNNVSINNSSFSKTILLDSGAPIGYVKKSLIDNLPIKRVVKDYNPYLGIFDAHVREVNYSFLNGSISFVHPCGDDRDVNGHGPSGPIDAVVGINNLFKESIAYDPITDSLYIN